MSKKHNEAVRLVNDNFPEIEVDEDALWLFNHGFVPLNADLNRWENETEYEPQPNEMTGVSVTVDVMRGYDKGSTVLQWKASQTYVDDDGMSNCDGPFMDTPKDALVALYEKMMEKEAVSDLTESN